MRQFRWYDRLKYDIRIYDQEFFDREWWVSRRSREKLTSNKVDMKRAAFNVCIPGTIILSQNPCMGGRFVGPVLQRDVPRIRLLS